MRRIKKYKTWWKKEKYGMQKGLVKNIYEKSVHRKIFKLLFYDFH